MVILACSLYAGRLKIHENSQVHKDNDWFMFLLWSARGQCVVSGGSLNRWSAGGDVSDVMQCMCNQYSFSSSRIGEVFICSM